MAPDAWGRVRTRGANVAPMREGQGGAQAVRDVLVLRAKYGMHGTEIDRLASGEGELTPVAKQRQIFGTLKFQHKTGRVHVLSVDKQAFAAAKRLQVGPALGKAGYGMREIGLALQFQRTLEFGACCRLLKRFGTHGMALAAIVKRRAV